MLMFVANKREKRVLSKELDQTGVLRLSTRVQIRGNYLKGNVPVRIRYEAQFTPDKAFWEQDNEYPDEEPYPVSYTRAFSTEGERREHCAVWYEVLTESVVQE